MVSWARLRQSVLPRRERDALFQRYMRAWAKGLLDLFAIEFTIQPQICGAGGARLVAANHRSPIDVALLLHHFGGCCVSRADLAGWPILGHAARRADTIFVDREDRTSGARAIRTIRERLRQGRTVIVFPEGGTFRGDEVRPFQPGVFAAARGLQVEVVPVGVAYQAGSEFVDESFVQHVLRIARRRGTRVALRIGTPSMARGSSDALARRLRAEVQDLVSEARQVCDR
ncbi:MAG: 1-acyl-sn-glycerol-3-phosphate acyltransferase [Proteobacteria bacterium]|nr:1-acyl-sn-glycerol-3-phosphate acyltransferase [Pseudomonadota bacterium]